MTAHTFNLGPRWPLYPKVKNSGSHSVGGYFAQPGFRTPGRPAHNLVIAGNAVPALQWAV
jgi:hypothetical protein